MTRQGTAHFTSVSAAIRYYKPYGFSDVDVARKIRNGEIHIGEPQIGDGERLVKIDNGDRYAIETVPYFAEGSEAMVALEAMVDKVGVRNVIYALSCICFGKATHVAEHWQDTRTAKVWTRWALRLDQIVARNPPDPLAP